MAKLKILLCLLLAALLLSGCMSTVDQMYYPPERSKDYNNLQSAMDSAMSGLEYSAPRAGENQQAVQSADLDGDGVLEYLLFAKGSATHPLKILVFRQVDEMYQHVQTIENTGIAFEQVEYIQADGTGGVEIVVGCQVADQVARSVSVYRFNKAMEVSTLVTTNCAKFLTVDLDEDGRTELFVLRSGQTDADYGIAELYGMENGSMARSNEVSMSQSADKLKRVLVGKLYDAYPAVYVASAVEETMLITDVYTCKDGMLANVSFSSDSGTSVKTLRNYYVYADDIDNDGVVELPSLITMKPVESGIAADRNDLIRWYALKSDGTDVDKMFTYHNFAGGWYLELDRQWAARLTVRQKDGRHEFYLWDPAFKDTTLLLTITTQTGLERSAEMHNGDVVLYSTESVTYRATVCPEAADYGITEESISKRFHLIQRDWKTGET